MASTQTYEREAPPSLHELLSHDADALAALRAAYSGTHEVLDAVWWREHPLSATPNGRPDPAAELPRLKALAFSRAGSAELVEVIDPESGEARQVPGAAAALAVAESRLRQDEVALDEALQDARPALDAAEARRRSAVEAARPSGEANAASRLAAGNGTAAAGADPEPGFSAPPAAVASSDPAAETWRRRSLVWMWTSIAAGLLLLVGVALVVAQQVNPQAGFGVLAGAGSGGGGASTAIPTPGPTDDVTAAGDPPPGLTIFENPELAPSIPPQNIDPYYKPESLRLLGVADSDLTVYAVENRIDQPCLLAVYQDGTQSATCVTKQEFNSMGIELRITSLKVTRPGDPAPYKSIAEDVVFWNPDGSYGVSSSPTRSQLGG